MPPARSHDEYTLSIRLAEIEPAIWRRIVVPGQLTLHQLHQVLRSRWAGRIPISTNLLCQAQTKVPTTVNRVQLHGEYFLSRFLENRPTLQRGLRPGGPAQPPETNPTDHQVTPASYALVPRLPQPSKPPLLSRSKRVAV